VLCAAVGVVDAVELAVPVAVPDDEGVPVGGGLPDGDVLGDEDGLGVHDGIADGPPLGPGATPCWLDDCPPVPGPV
jgi:hypothetical protein